MTAIQIGTGSSAPLTITELMQLVVWNSVKINEIQPKEERLLYANFPKQRIVSYQTFETPEYGIRHVLQVIIKLNADWQSADGKLWEKAVPILRDNNSPENILQDTFTRGTGGSIPSGVNTHAKLAMWCADAVRRVSPTEQVIENPAFGPVDVVQLNLGRAFDGYHTALIRYSIPIEDNYQSSTDPFWLNTKAINYVPLPPPGQLVPYHSPLNPNFARGFSQPQLPPAGGTTPPYGFRLQPNNLTNIKPNLGPPVNFSGKTAKGNVNRPPVPKLQPQPRGNGAVAGQIAVGGFGLGLDIGTQIYIGAENPDSIVYDVVDFFDRKIRDPLGLEDKKRAEWNSRGGVEVSPEILPFTGGQVVGQLYIVETKLSVVVWDTWDNNRVVGNATQDLSLYVRGPISKIEIRDARNREGVALVAVGQNGSVARAESGGGIHPRWWDIATPNGFNVVRVDNTSQAADRAQGGNPNPISVGSYEPRTTTINITNNTTNNITNNFPPPFAEPPDNRKAWPAPPILSPPSPVGSPSGSPSGSPIGNIAPGNYPAPIGTRIGNIAPGNYPAPSGNTTLAPVTRISSGTAYGSSGPQPLTPLAGPLPFAEPEPFSPFPSAFIPLAPPAVQPNNSNPQGLRPVDSNGQPQNQPQPERERRGLPVPDTGGSCCALPAIESGNNQILERLNQVNNAGQTVMLTEVLNRLGPQVQGGLSGWLGRFSRSIKLDRVLNVLQFAIVLHNAGMLSRSLIDSISYFIDSASQAFGLKDEDDQPLNLTAILGSSISSFLESVLGAELYRGLSFNWKKLSAIYTAAVNVYQLTTNSMAGIAEGLETVGNYTGQIGNALKRGGLIFENAYNWMNEHFSIKSGKFAAIQKITDGISQADSIVNDLTSVTEEIISTQENIQQIQTEFKTIKDSFKDIEEQKVTKENQARIDSLTPNITRENLLEGDN